MINSPVSTPDHGRSSWWEGKYKCIMSRAPGASITYRRRTENTGFKAGNIAEFLHRRHRDYDYFLPLDADSVMGARAVLRLVRVMQASPGLGMLQGLVVGTPSDMFFTRAFQFGMRHGMRSFTLGSAWWQGECGPSWGHRSTTSTSPGRTGPWRRWSARATWALRR